MRRHIPAYMEVQRRSEDSPRPLPREVPHLIDEQEIQVTLSISWLHVTLMNALLVRLVKKKAPAEAGA